MAVYAELIEVQDLPGLEFATQEEVDEATILIDSLPLYFDARQNVRTATAPHLKIDRDDLEPFQVFRLIRAVAAQVRFNRALDPFAAENQVPGTANAGNIKAEQTKSSRVEYHAPASGSSSSSAHPRTNDQVLTLLREAVLLPPVRRMAGVRF